MMKSKTFENDDSKAPGFAELVNMQGLQLILDPKSSSFRKYVWVIIVLGALTFTTYNITKQLLHYVSYPINVNIDIKRAKELPFPTVTLCNLNCIQRKIAEEKNIVSLVKLMKPLVFISQSQNATPSYDGLDFSEYQTPGAWEVVYEDLGHHIPDVILQCRWERGNCDVSDFKYSFTDFGVCFVFNDDGQLKARNSGRDYGLRLSLHAQLEEYLRSFAGHYGAGYKIAIHPNGVPPILSEIGVSVSPGFHNSLAIDVKKLKNADKSVSKCGSKALKYYKDKPYSIQACRQECMTEYVVGKCGCREIFMPGNDTLVCDPPELYSCIYPTIDEYVKTSDKTCEKTCPDPCSTFLYDTKVSATPLSDNFLAEYSNAKGGNFTYWQKNFVELEIYLTSMSYESIEKQLAYSLLDLLCDVGGALGLLLGASFLTVLEIMDFLVLRPRETRGKGKGKVETNRINVQAANPRY